MGEPSKGTAEPYKGPSGVIGDTFWFSYADIKGDGDMVVLIEEVRARRGVKFASGPGKPVEYFLKFAGIEKELRVNPTIRRVLDNLFTTDTAKWWGKSIALFVQQGVRNPQGEGPAVRVRNRQVQASEQRQGAAAWSRVNVLRWLLEPEQRAATKKCATAMGLAVTTPKDLIPLTDDQVKDLEKRVLETPPDSTDAREPGGEG